MQIHDLFSKRQKKLRGELPDIYTYDQIPQKLRGQIAHIICDTIGTSSYNYEDLGYNWEEDVYRLIQDILCREYGKFQLTESPQSCETDVLNFLLQITATEEALDVIELSFQIIDTTIRNKDANCPLIAKNTPDEGIKTLNARFQEHGIGYSFDGGQIIRVDSTYTHSEITKPVIALLLNPKFKGANEEYLKAHDHYRHGRNKECLNECLKAFESTMKVICTEKGWSYNPNDSSKRLIEICFNNELIPKFMQDQFASLQKLFESGVPTIRNKISGHGQGPIPQPVDAETTRYGLNLTGTSIIFFVEKSGLN